MSTSDTLPAYRLINPIQTYAWGTRDAAAFIPHLLGMPAQPGQPYAELWLGAHPSAPSQVHTPAGRIELPRWLAQAPEQRLGADTCARFGPQLPFLFKVLSIAEPLSIQTHPNAELARHLHARDPQHYPDPYSKPELVIALTPMEALVGFRPPADWPALARRYPALRDFIPRPWPGDPDSLRHWYSALIRRSAAAPQALQALLSRLDLGLRALPDRTPAEQLFLALRPRYPGPDIGLVTLLLLNWVSLDPGAALYLAPGTPHAYLSGNALECMRNSDNVVRAGLTQKYIDWDALLQTLDFSACAPHHVGLATSYGRLYHVPEAALAVARITSQAGEQRQVTLTGPAILLVLEGEISLPNEERYARGESAFLPATPGHIVWRQRIAGHVILASHTVPHIT